MKSFIVLIGIVMLSVNTWSQKPAIIMESWNSNPALHKIESKHSNESAVILLDKRRVEYADEGKEGLMMYRTMHKIVKVNDDKGIEAFNTVYLGVSDNGDIVDIKARTILPNKKIIEVDRKNIKDLKEENGNEYKIFALEGLEKGCEVEYYYTYKIPSSFFGREILQDAYPVLQTKVEIVAPERLVFESKMYNAGNDFKKVDTVLDSKRISSVEYSSIDGVEDEKYSSYRANLLRLEFKLSYNLSRSANERLLGWNELAKRIYDIYTSYSEKELKKVQSYISSNKWDKLATEKEKITAVENYLKKNITTREDISSEDAENLELVIKNKIASYRGIIRLYGAIYRLLNIDYQFVLTGDRSEFAVDKSFENWNNTENPILYFTSQKKFLAPTRLDMRYPWIYPYWGATNGMFCKGTTIGNFNTAIAEIKPVSLEHYSQTAGNIEADLSFNKTMDTLMVDAKHMFTGYMAGVYRASFNFTSAEQQKDILKELIRTITNSENVIESKISNQDFESYSDNKPFILHAKVKAHEMLEKAGNKILVKLGEIIGQQVEMYQEKPRKFPMEIQFPHVLERWINFTIPEGYIVENPNDIKINAVYKENDELTMGFVSDYTQEGNMLKVHVVEEYRKTAYPLSQYEDFKKVINAAADFNKVVLVLKKK